MKTTSYEISRGIANKNGINRKTFAARVRKGWSLEDAASKPLFKKEDISNKRFGRLVAVELVAQDDSWNDKYLCKCDCGNQTIVLKLSLKSGDTRSCGCLMREIFTKHKACKDKTYIIWQGMKQRCFDKKSKNYSKYGGRGITMCKEWREDYLIFLKDMGEVPEGKSIERIDNNGNYEPSNCKWATIKEQARNKRNSLIINYKGQSKHLLDWCEELNLSYNLIRDRLRKGWETDKAFETPKIWREIRKSSS